MDRAEFLSASLTAAAAMAGILIGCGDSETEASSSTGSPTGSGGSASSNTGGSSSTGLGGRGIGGDGGGIAADCTVDINSQISCRHDHELIITAADLEAGIDKTYDIQGTSPHSHMVTVTSDDFDRLKQGETVQIFVPAAIPHDIVIKCSGLEPNALDLDCP